jgi:hypothetical protein
MLRMTECGLQAITLLKISRLSENCSHNENCEETSNLLDLLDDSEFLRKMIEAEAVCRGEIGVGSLPIRSILNLLIQPSGNIKFQNRN